MGFIQQLEFQSTFNQSNLVLNLIGFCPFLSALKEALSLLCGVIRFFILCI